MSPSTSLPDPTIDLGWDDFRGGKVRLWTLFGRH